MNPSIIIHAGLPRTATTTLQKTLFPEYCRHPLYTKDRMSSMILPHEGILAKLNMGQKLTNAEIARTIFTAATLTYKNSDQWFSLLLNVTEKLLKNNQASDLPALLSSEALTLTIAGYNMRPSEAGRQFGVISLIKAVNKLTNEPPKVILCLRDPIEHFVSMFIRVVRQGVIELKDFNRYIKFQLRLESNLKYSSNIAHLYHKSLITYLTDLNSIVTPIRYEDLLKTSDALSLLKLDGDKISLSKLKKENHHLTEQGLNISKEQINDLQTGLKNAFEAIGIYEIIYNEAFL